MEHKTCKAFVLNTDDAQGIVECIFSVMGIIDEGLDIVHNGAFTKTWNERAAKIRVLDSHNNKSILSALGKPLSFRELPRSELPQEIIEQHPEATGAAWARVQFNMKTDAGRDAYWHIAGGDVDEWSFGYDALDKDHSKAMYQGQEVVVRNLRTIKQYELSPTIFGMNTATMTTDAKSAETKPWGIVPMGEQFCVFKLDENGEPTGEPECYDSEDEANDYMRALYANEGKADKATWTRAYINDLPDSSFLHIESGGEKDEDGKTTPRSLRHFPYKDGDGNVDLPHLRNALSRLGQSDTGTTEGESWLTDALREKLRAKAEEILKKETADKQKSMSLSQLVHDVHNAFSEQYNTPNAWDYWVREVFDNYVIACHSGSDGQKFYKIGYTRTENDGIQFAPRADWVEGQYLFIAGPPDNSQTPTSPEVGSETEKSSVPDYLKLIEIERLKAEVR